MHIALGVSLRRRHKVAPELRDHTRAQQLCQHLEDPQQLFPVLRGLHGYYNVRAEYQTAHGLGEQILTPAASPRCCHAAGAHRALGRRYSNWELSAAAHTLTQGIALYDVHQHRASAFLWRGRWGGLPWSSFGRCGIWDILTRG